MSNYESNSPHNKCTKTSCQYADISLPVELKPTATVSDVEIECCGEPKVICECMDCCNTCTFTILQKICIKIPVTYSVTACVEDGTICCDARSCDCCD